MKLNEFADDMTLAQIELHDITAVSLIDIPDHFVVKMHARHPWLALSLCLESTAAGEGHGRMAVVAAPPLQRTGDKCCQQRSVELQIPVQNLIILIITQIPFTG